MIVARRVPAVSTRRRDPHRSAIWLEGEHDISTVSALAEVLAKAIATNDADLVAHLSEVTFLDAASVGVLLRAREFLGRRSRLLELRSPSPRAMRILELCEVALVDDRMPMAIVGVARSSGPCGTAVRSRERRRPHVRSTSIA